MLINVGIPYTLWVEVEAESVEAAKSIVATTDYNLRVDAPATIELNEFDDMIIGN